VELKRRRKDEGRRTGHGFHNYVHGGATAKGWGRGSKRNWFRAGKDHRRREDLENTREGGYSPGEKIDGGGSKMLLDAEEGLVPAFTMGRDELRLCTWEGEAATGKTVRWGTRRGGIESKSCGN